MINYQVELSKSIKDTIILIFDSDSPKSKNKQHYLVKVFCRYVERLEPQRTLDEKVRDWLNCTDCIKKVYNYFEAKISEWTDDGWHEHNAINKENDIENDYKK